VSARTRSLYVGLASLAAVTASLIAAQRTMAATTTTITAAPSTSGTSDLVARGRALYLTGCVSCHDVDGSGVDNRGPSIIGVGAASADFFLTTGRMPASNPPDVQTTRKHPAYPPDDIAALTAFVASLGPGPPIPNVVTAGADVVRGGVIYRANCAACHQAVGIGGALSYGHFAPPLDDATAVQVVEAMRIGPGQMPVFDEASISAQDADAVAAYVEYLRSPEDKGGLSLGHSGPVGEGFVALLFGLGGMVVVSIWIVGRRHA
jgi:ubiquinol-cytochrome c reductase cytochrome c subunit